MKILFFALTFGLSSTLFASLGKMDSHREDLKNKIKPRGKQDKITKPISVAYNSKLPLLEKYKLNYSKQGMASLRDDTLRAKFDAVPVLTKVMKDASFPEKNRWVATFLLGKIMGKKSASYISKFARHPNWMMRLASLKALLSLKQKEFKGIYAHALKDPSMIVRYQALENIKYLELTELAPHVWAMLYDKSNYSGQDGSHKRSHIIKEVIKTVGHLKFDKAKKPMLTMIQKEKYRDIFEELDHALNEISEKDSPKGSVVQKRHYWSRVSLSEVKI